MATSWASECRTSTGLITTFYPKARSESDDSSAPQSVLSDDHTLLSSRSSITLDGVSLDAADQFVNLLLGHEQLNQLCTKAIESDIIGPVRFERNFKGLLKLYGTDLRKEALEFKKDTSVAVGYVDQRSRYAAAEFIVRRSRYAAVKVRQLCDSNFTGNSFEVPESVEDKRQTLDRYLKGLNETDENFGQTIAATVSSGSSDGADISEGDEYERLVHLTSVESFMTNSRAFSVLCLNLANGQLR